MGLTVKQAAERVGVSPRHVRRICARGRVPGALREGKSWAIPETAIAVWQSYLKPVGRPPAPVEIPPPDVSPAYLVQLLVPTKTYEQVWAVALRVVPRWAERLEQEVPVLTDAQLDRLTWIADPRDVPDPGPGRQCRMPNRLSAHWGSGPRKLTLTVIATLTPDVKAARADYAVYGPI